MRVAGDVSGADSVLCWQTGYPFSVSLSQGYPAITPSSSRRPIYWSARSGRGSSGRIRKPETFPLAAIDHLKSIPTIVLDHPFSGAPFEPTLCITTDVYGVHRHGIAYRMDEVPIPFGRSFHPARPATERY